VGIVGSEGSLIFKRIVPLRVYECLLTMSGVGAIMALS